MSESPRIHGRKEPIQCRVKGTGRSTRNRIGCARQVVLHCNTYRIATMYDNYREHAIGRRRKVTNRKALLSRRQYCPRNWMVEWKLASRKRIMRLLVAQSHVCPFERKRDAFSENNRTQRRTTDVWHRTRRKTGGYVR